MKEVKSSYQIGLAQSLRTTKSWKQRKDIGENICILGTAPPVSAAAFFTKEAGCTGKEKTKTVLVVLRGIKKKRQRMES